MIKKGPQYSIDGVSFDSLYNRNEYLVRRELKRILDEEGITLSAKEVQDVYALTLNDFPAHYIHTGTIVLNPNVQKNELRDQIKKNILYVYDRPKA